MNKKKDNKKGFTLIEVIVSMSIFVLVSITFTATFAGIMRAYQKARNINENLENAQFALSLLGKTIRTSTLKYPTNAEDSDISEIVVFDYSRGGGVAGPSCLRYRFSGGALTQTAVAQTEPNCNLAAFSGSTEENMTTGNVTGRFRVTNSKGDPATKASEKVGMVTVGLSITTGTGTAQTKATNIQTTVSLRDYEVSNIGVDI